MKLIFIAGLFCVFNCVHVNGENQEFPLSSENSAKVKKLLCAFFPKYVKSDCSESVFFSDKNLETSAEIDIHIHIKTDSENDSLNGKESEDKRCRDCKVIVKFYEKYTNKTLTPEYVQQQLFEVCGIYKNPLYNECLNFYKNEGFDVIKAILKSEDPKEVCQILNLCQKKDEGIQYHQFLDLFMILLKPKDSEQCQFCINAVPWFENNINNSMNAVQIQHKLLYGCNIFKDHLRTDCIVYHVTKGLQIIKDILKREDPKKICQNIGFCRKEENDKIMPAVTKPVKTFSPASPDIVCEICVNTVYSHEIILNKSFSASNIQKVSLGMCQILNSDVKKKCITFWNGVGLQVINDILNSENPAKICQLMNTCIKKFGNFGQKNLPDLFFIKLFNKYNSCDICKYEIAYYEKVINMSQTAEQVQHRVLAACSLFKTPYKESCTNYYENKGLELIKALLKKEDPQTVCHNSDLCKSNVESFGLKPILSENVQNSDIIQDKNLKSIECFICKEVMKELKTILNKPKSKEEIIHALNQVCHLLPHHWRNKCDHFIHKYSDRIVNYIINNVGFDQICGLLQLCSDKVVNQDDNLYFFPKFTYSLD